MDFPAPVGPTTATRAETDGEVDVLEDPVGLAGTIREGHVVERDIGPGRQVHSPHAFGHAGAGVEQPVELEECGTRLLHEVEELAYLLDGIDEIRQQEHERGDRAHGDPAVVDHEAADPTTAAVAAELANSTTGK